MEISILLAKFWGIFMLAEALIYFFRLSVVLDRIRDRSYIALDGYLSFTLGLATVILHNVWTTDWRVAVTVVGWLLLFRGVARIGWPDTVYNFSQKFTGKPMLIRTGLVGVMVFGAWLIWVSG